jgi:hypothetical protein
MKKPIEPADPRIADDAKHEHHISDPVEDIPAAVEPPTGNAYIGRRKAFAIGATFGEIHERETGKS